MTTRSKKNPGDQGRQHPPEDLQPLENLEPLDLEAAVQLTAVKGVLFETRLARVVSDFLSAHDKVESKYWPMLEVFLERLEKGLPVKRVTSDFHWAYRKVKQLDQGEVIPGYWYTIVNEIRRVALMGRSWIEEHRARNIGFWKLLELANFELQEPRGKSRGKDRSAIKNKHFAYFLVENPAEFPFLFALWTEGKIKLPNFEKRDHKDLKAYEKMCVRLLDRMLAEPSFFFDPELNWPSLCQRILQQIQPAQFREQLEPGVVRVVPTILDIETEEPE